MTKKMVTKRTLLGAAVNDLTVELERVRRENVALRDALQRLYNATISCTSHGCMGLRNGYAAVLAYNELTTKR